MKVTNSDATADLHKRLRRVEGQVRGVQKMLDDERDCREIIQQLNAIQSAVRNASVVFMRTYARDCPDRFSRIHCRRSALLSLTN